MFRPITINAVLNGWIVQCGCQTVVYQERNQLVSDLDAYLKDPAATEERFLKTGVNQGHTMGGGPIGGGVDMATSAPSRDVLRTLSRERDAATQGSGPRG